ncbi:hypothetical protein ACHAXR_010789 [Thalassiosira sp. AJA248-18]
MDSDDDGNYGYDIPDDGGPGFQMAGSKPSHLLGKNNYSSNDDDDNNNSSDDDDDVAGQQQPHNDNFAYGAYGAKKRRRRERQSKSTDKERNLYGVFYEDSSDDDDRGSSTAAAGGGSRGNKKSRHFDKRQNRMAGLAFVKSSSSTVAAAPVEDAERKSDDHDDDGRATKTNSSRREDGGMGDDNVPSWLKDKTRVQPSAKSGTTEMKHESKNVKKSKFKEASDDDMDIEDENNDINDEEEMKRIHDREKQFNELLTIAKTSKNPVSKPSGVKNSNSAGNEKIRQKNDAPTSDDKNNMLQTDDRGGIRSHGGIGFGKNDEYGTQHSAPTGIGFASSGGGGGARSKPIISEAGTGGAGGGSLGLGMAANGIGLGHKSSMATFESNSEHDSGMPPYQGGLGLGMGAPGMGGLGSNFPSFNQGSMGLGLGSNTQPAKKKDPNLGKWEKHTKGIGMKLLQKMGYGGSGGLGAKRRRGGAVESSTSDGNNVRDETLAKGEAVTAAMTSKEEGSIKKGISRPVEVVVRPHGLGLGFGNFKEQSQLKVNRQIEAEVRGLELPKEESEKNGERVKKGIFDGIDKSLLPSTESLLNRGANNWRKGKAKKKAKRKVINYQDILDKTEANDGPEKMKIIDMRGTSSIPKHASVQQSDSTSQPSVPIGEELLHNVTLLLNTHEGQLRTSSYMVKSTQQKISSLEKEYEELVERKDGIKNRSSKMKLALDGIEQAEQLIEKISSMEKDRHMSKSDKLDFAIDSLQGIFVNLYSNFSKEERKSLKFDATLIPSIVKPLLESLTSTLNPLKLDLLWMDNLATGVQKLCDTVGSDNEAYALREMIFIQIIVPWIQNSLSSSKWDPVVNVETGLRIYESVLNCACSSFLDAEEEENNLLKENITDEVVQNTIIPKLLRAVSHWRPKFDDMQQIANPLHLWILPWLPHIANDSMLGTLLSDVRRNLKKTLSFLSKSVSNDVVFIRSCIVALVPWKRLFEESAVFELTSHSVTPRFARSLARVKIDILPAEQDWGHLHILFEYFEKGLMSCDDFLSLIEGEVLPAWANALHSALKQKDPMNEIKEFYIAWKEQFFEQSTNITPRDAQNPQLTLCSDSMVCRYFFGGLKMIQATFESNEALLDGLLPPHPTDCNYRISSMHRSKERKPQNNDQTRVNVRVQQKLHGNGKMAASFKEVVEAFANQHDIAFFPKSGSNSMKDGKPVFMFGDHPIYFDKNVLFALRGSAWRPISLEHLAQSC